MRHFLHLALAPGTLPRRVQQRSAVAQLIAGTSTALRFASADLRARARTILVAAVTVAADTHLHGAPRTIVESIRLCACLHAPPRRTGQGAAILA